MQTVDLTKFTNSQGWVVIHNPETFMYEIKAANGKKKPGCWTNKRMAEYVLYQHLDDVQKHNDKIRKKSVPAKKKKAEKDAAEVVSAESLQLAIN